MSVLAKARELGEALYQSPEFETLRADEAAMTLDPAASRILRELAELEADIKAVMDKPELGELLLKPKMDRYQALRLTAREHPLIARYQNSSHEFSQLMSQINSIISFYVTGQTGEESGCPSCGPQGCAGCTACQPTQG